jgi:phage tail tape-measure protein
VGAFVGVKSDAVGIGVGNAVWGANVGIALGAPVGEAVGTVLGTPHLASANAFVSSYWNFDELVSVVSWKLSTPFF